MACSAYLNLPAVQTVHSVSPTPLKVPAWQSLHELLPPARLNLPSRHFSHLLAAVPDDVPAGQVLHAVLFAFARLPASLFRGWGGVGSVLSFVKGV